MATEVSPEEGLDQALSGIDGGVIASDRPDFAEGLRALFRRRLNVGRQSIVVGSCGQVAAAMEKVLADPRKSVLVPILVDLMASPQKPLSEGESGLLNVVTSASDRVPRVAAFADESIIPGTGEVLPGRPVFGKASSGNIGAFLGRNLGTSDDNRLVEEVLEAANASDEGHYFGGSVADERFLISKADGRDGLQVSFMGSQLTPRIIPAGVLRRFPGAFSKTAGPNGEVVFNKDWLVSGPAAKHIVRIPV